MRKQEDLSHYLPSPARRAPTQEFDYLELVADPKFHAVVYEHGRNGSFAGLDEGTPEYNSKLKAIALAFVGVVNEKRITLFRNQGIINGRRGAFREAVSCYNRALEISRNSPSKHVTLANRSAAYIKREMFAEALEDAQEASFLCPEYSIAYSLMGYCHSRLGMGKKAVVNYNTALQLNPADVSSQDLLDDVKKTLLMSGVTADAIADLEAPCLASREQAERERAEQEERQRQKDKRERQRDEEYQTIEDIPNSAPVTLVRKGSDDEEEVVEGIQQGVESIHEILGPTSNAGWVSPKRERPRRSSSGMNSPGKNESGRPRLTRKLSTGSAKAFASLTQLSDKIKNVLGKNRGRTSSKGDLNPQHSGGDPPQRSGNGKEVSVASVSPNSAGMGTALAPAVATEVPTAGTPQGGYIKSTSDNGPPAAPGALAAGGSGGGIAPVGVPSSTDPSASGVIVDNSGAGNGRGSSAVATREAEQQRFHQQHQQQHHHPQRDRHEASKLQPLPPQNPSHATLIPNAGEQRPDAQRHVAKQQERPRDKSKNRRLRDRRPFADDDTPGNSSGKTTPSLTTTPVSGMEDAGLKTPALQPGPGREPVGTERPATGRASLRPDPPQGTAPTHTMECRVDGADRASNDSGHEESSESDYSDGTPMSARVIAAVAVAVARSPRFPDGTQRPSALSSTAPAFRRALSVEAMAEVVVHAGGQLARSPEKAGWTTASSVSDGDISSDMGGKSGEVQLRPVDVSPEETEVRDAEDVEAGGTITHGVETDEGSKGVPGRTVENTPLIEGESGAWEEKELPAKEGQKVHAVPVQSLAVKHQENEAKATRRSFFKRDRQPTNGEVLRTVTSAGELITSSPVSADAPGPKIPGREGDPVRSKIELFEGRARSSLGGAGARLKSTIGRKTGLRRVPSLPEKLCGHGSAVPVAEGMIAPQSAFGKRRLMRSLSFRSSTRARERPLPSPTDMPVNAQKGVSPSRGS